MSLDHEGPGVSPVDARLNLGRASVQRVDPHHEGQKSDPTATIAIRTADKSMSAKGPTPEQIKGLFDQNPLATASYRAAGMSDREIYKILEKTT